MATSLKSLPKFFGLTAAQYAALTTKDANTLYFVFDEGVNGLIYRGSNVYGETIKYVSTVPAAVDAMVGVVYFDTTTSTAYVKAGTAMKPVGVLTVDVIDDSTTADDKKVPNVGAVKDYVKDKVASLLHFKGVVDTPEDLPSTGNVQGDCYLVKTVSGTPAKTNVEFVWLDAVAPETSGHWEELGSTFDFSIFVQKKTSAVNGDIAKFDASGDVIDSGKVASEAEVVPASDEASVDSLANELEVAASLEAEASLREAADSAEAASREAADATKLNKGAVKGVTNADEIITAGGTDEAPAAVASGKKLGADSDVITASSAANTVATEVAVAAAVKVEKDRAEGVEALKLDEITGTTGNILTVAESGAAVADSGKTFSTSTTVPASTDTSVNKVANELEVANLKESLTADYQLRDKDAVAGNVAKMNSNGDSEDSGFSFGGGTITTVDASDAVLATEEAVIALVNQMAWQTIED